MAVMNTGVILMICGGIFAGVGILMAILEVILAPKRKEDIYRRMREKY